jgi:cytochrome P450
MEQSEYLYRRVVRPIVIDDYSIPAGWLLRICVQESHRDPAIFTDPNGFNPDRFLGRGFGRGEYSPFGADNHGCMGVPLVHFLGKIFVEELCHGYQWRVTRDGPLDRGSRHRHHWRPSAARRVVGVPIGGVARNNQPLGAEAADSTPV